MTKAIFYLFAVAVSLLGTVAFADEWEEYGVVCTSGDKIKFYTGKEVKSFSADPNDKSKKVVLVVNQLIQQGWQPLGGIDTGRFCQSMVK